MELNRRQLNGVIPVAGARDGADEVGVGRGEDLGLVGSAGNPAQGHDAQGAQAHEEDAEVAEVVGGAREAVQSFSECLRLLEPAWGTTMGR